MKNFMINILAISILACISACSFNVSMAHTQGTAEDVIDDAASNTPDVSPTITLPVSAIPGV